MPSSKHRAVISVTVTLMYHNQGRRCSQHGGTETKDLLNVHGTAPHHRVISPKMSIVPSLRSPDIPNPRVCEFLHLFAARPAALNATQGVEKFSTSTNATNCSLSEDHRLVQSAEAAAVGGRGGPRPALRGDARKHLAELESELN